MKYLSYMYTLGYKEVRCSSVVRAFVHGAMGRQIDLSWWTHWAGVTKAVVCVILSVG